MRKVLHAQVFFVELSSCPYHGRRCRVQYLASGSAIRSKLPSRNLMQVRVRGSQRGPPTAVRAP